MRRRILIALIGIVVLIAAAQLLFQLWFADPPAAPEATPLVHNEAPQQPASDAITVRSVEGRVEHRVETTTDWLLLRSGDILGEEEQVRTAADGRAILGVGDIALVEMPGDSQVSMREVTESVARVRLDRGRVSAEALGASGAVLRLEAKDSDAVAETSDGRMSMVNSGTGHVTVAAEKGRVTLSASSKTVELIEGTQSVVMPQTAPSAPETIPTSLFLKVDRLATMQRETTTTVRGKASPGAVINVNGTRTIANTEGDFATEVALTEGSNALTVVATDASGRRKTLDVGQVTVKSSMKPVRAKSKWRGEQAPTKVKW